MKMTNKEYSEYIKKKRTNPHVAQHTEGVVGGLICCLDRGCCSSTKEPACPSKTRPPPQSALCFGRFPTGFEHTTIWQGLLGGTLVPITGFVNSVVS